MATLGEIEDLDLTTVHLDDGTPLLVEWVADAEGQGGTWVARQSLPASAVNVDLDPMGNRLSPVGLYPESASVQELFDLLLRQGFNSYRLVTDDDPDGPTQARSFLLTDYRRALGPTDIGSNGSLFGLSYGRAGAPAGGFANATCIVAEVRGSEDPANEIGGCIGSLQLGRGSDPPPTASLWGSSYTLRGSVGRQPGGLMGYTAVIQNYFDGSGSRSDNYGYAAVTRPGIGDGADFHAHDPIREATTYPVDLGFVVCGDSGPHPHGGDIGYRVAFQAGGGASPWSPREHWRSKIGTGMVVRDWVHGGIHVHRPHDDAVGGDVGPQLRLDVGPGQAHSVVECRGGDEVLAELHPDGRWSVAAARDADDAVTLAQLDSLRAELGARLDRLDQGLATVSTAAMCAELAGRVVPVGRRLVRGARRRAARLVGRGGPPTGDGPQLRT